MDVDHSATRRSSAQVYALTAGAALTILGIAGFFYNSAFTNDKSVRDAVLGIFDVNGWHNVVHIATGVTGLIAAGSFASGRTYALVFGAIITGLAICGFAVGNGGSILSILPINTADNILHLLIGISGIAAGMATPAVADPAGRPAPA
jgi:hypothetical protein